MLSTKAALFSRALVCVEVVLRVAWACLRLNAVYGQHNFSTSIFVRFRQIWTVYCSYSYYKDTGLGM